MSHEPLQKSFDFDHENETPRLRSEHYEATDADLPDFLLSEPDANTSSAGGVNQHRDGTGRGNRA